MKKRYLIKIYDTNLGCEYDFDADNFKINSEKGVFFNKEDGNILDTNYQERHLLMFWSGFEEWEDFQTVNKIIKDN